MAHRDRAAVHVEPVHRDAKTALAIEGLGSEGLVEFPEVDVLDLEAMALQQAGHGVDRAYSHFVGGAARHGHAAERAQRFEIGALGVAGFHQHAGGGTVGQLRGVARGDEPVRTHDGRQARQAVGGGRGAVAVVGADGDFFLARGAGCLVRDLHGGAHGDDFGVEAAFALGCRRQLLAAQGERVLVFAADAVALRDDVGGGDHGQVEFGQLRLEPAVDAAHAVVARAQQRAAFHAAGDDGARMAHDHAGGGVGHGLQAGGAEAVDGGAGDALRQSGAQRRLAGHVAAGGAFRITAAQDHVLDAVRVHAGALDGGPDGVGGQGGALGDVEFAAPGLGERGARGGDDDGFSHDGAIPQGCRFSLPKVEPSRARRRSSSEGAQNAGSSLA
jgi:hypothetical protein